MCRSERLRLRMLYACSSMNPSLQGRLFHLRDTKHQLCFCAALRVAKGLLAFC